MTRQIEVSLLPALVVPGSLDGQTAIVIDVLRATTTIVHAMAAGADAVVPCQTIEQAQEQAAQMPGALLGGERGGKKIAGFDLGNSPAEYNAETVRGKTIVFTTTNGTRAMQACQSARQILIAAFVNLNAVCREAADCHAVHIVCAGTNGEITREDVLLAGAIVDLLDDDSNGSPQLNDQALLAKDAWQLAKTGLTATSLADRLRISRGGRNVLEIGMETDIDLAAVLDKFDLVPKLHPPRWQITL